MLVGKAVEYCLIAYGFLFAISLAVAAMIKLMYWIVNKSGKTKPDEGKEA